MFPFNATPSNQNTFNLSSLFASQPAPAAAAAAPQSMSLHQQSQILLQLQQLQQLQQQQQYWPLQQQSQQQQPFQFLQNLQQMPLTAQITSPTNSLLNNQSALQQQQQQQQQQLHQITSPNSIDQLIRSVESTLVQNSSLLRAFNTPKQQLDMNQFPLNGLTLNHPFVPSIPSYNNYANDDAPFLEYQQQQHLELLQSEMMAPRSSTCSSSTSFERRCKIVELPEQLIANAAAATSAVAPSNNIPATQSSPSSQKSQFQSQQLSQQQQQQQKMQFQQYNSLQLALNQQQDESELEAKRALRRLKIEKYRSKRRNWDKLVAYTCRKKIADQRIRIKGRFVSTKQAQALQTPVIENPTILA